MISTLRQALDYGSYPVSNTYLSMFTKCRSSLSFILTLIVFLGVLGPSNTDGASRITLTPRLTLTESYIDNLDLVNDKIEDPDSDWITMVSPGFQLLYETPKANLTLDYEAGLEYYLNDSSRDTTRHNGLFSWDHQLTPSFTWRANNLLLVSDDPVTVVDGQTLEVAQERQTRYRNFAEASFTWRYAPENSLTAGYRNRFFTSDSDDEEESIANEVFFNLDNWVVPRFGINVESYGNRTEFDQPNGFTMIPTDDFYQYLLGLTLNYRWRPEYIFYARYRILGQDFDRSDASTSDNYIVHEPVLGFNLTLSPQIQFLAEGGYFKQEVINRNYGTDGFYGNFGLNAQMNRTTIGITGNSGYELDYTTTTNRGFSKVRGFGVNAQYQLTRSISLSGSGEYQWQDYVDINTTEQTYIATALIDYTIRPWLRLSLEGTRLRRESTDNTGEFRDFRFTFSLRLSYPWRIK